MRGQALCRSSGERHSGHDRSLHENKFDSNSNEMPDSVRREESRVLSLKGFQIQQINKGLITM